MKVLHILSTSRFSGAENVVCQIINLFRQEKGIDMAYCSPDGQIREELKTRDIPFLPIKSLSKKEVAKAAKAYGATVIHAHDRRASLVSARANTGLPIISHMHVNDTKGIKAFLKNVVWLLMSFKFKRVFWVSQSAYDNFPGHWLLKHKSTVLPNVIDPVFLRNRANACGSCDDYDVAFVGRLCYQKDPEKLMRILKCLCQKRNGIRACIIGDGEYADYVRGFIYNNGIADSVHYLGYLPNPLGFIKRAKVMVLTSRFEGTPMVVLEALGLGTPVVSTPVDGVKDIIVNGQNGFMCSDDATFVDCALSCIDASANMEERCLQSFDKINGTLAYKRNIQAAYASSIEKH